MSGIDSLRDKARGKQEEAATASAPVFVRACPGAGKTRVLVERHLRTEAMPRRTGRALLSFTNVAADELRDRCDGNRPDLTAFPHYIGTFDRFLWRYLVRPFLPAGPTWRHLRSWDQVPSAIVGHRKVPLAEFRFDYDPSTNHTLVRWPNPGNRLTNSTFSAESYCALAERVRDRLQRDHGYMTGHEIRVAALGNVEDPSVAELLRHRFFEIVVDEAQDCSQLDLALLSHLLDANLPLVVVADPDQGIYEWNDARPQELLALARRLPQHVELNGNWRSSAPICRLAATLRPAPHTVPDLSVGAHHAVDTPVVLLPYGFERRKSSGLEGPNEAVEAFTELAAREGIGNEDCLVLAHSNASVLRIRSEPALKAPKKPDTVALARAAAVFGTGEADRNTREQALEIAAQLLNAYWHPDGLGSLSASLAEHGITPALMRRRSALFLASLPPVDTIPAGQWRKKARTIWKAQRPPSGTDPTDPPMTLSLAKDLSDTPINALIGLLGTPASASEPPKVRSSNIHQAKGSEAEAVLVHIPPSGISELIEAWSDPSRHTGNCELLRTYYVAITRARRFLAFTYPRSQHAEVVRLLNSLGIDHQMESHGDQLTVF
ncbi:ATP-dependent DNA helicase Rep [Nocardiopsis dassonvillei]|uniref:UvrD-helicase domain-containing protein n=1 Tax=Nocardiopsis dassonvillei TaxID=2014 RepID=UPI003F571B67